MLGNENTVSYLYSFSNQRGRRKTIKTDNKKKKLAVLNENSSFSTSFDVLLLHKRINYLQNQAGNHFLFQQERFLKSIGAPSLTISSWDMGKGLPCKNNFFPQYEGKENRAEKKWYAVCQHVSTKSLRYFHLLRKVAVLSPHAVFDYSINDLQLRKALDLLAEYYRVNAS